MFPELARRGLAGAFYPPVGALDGNKVLDVNKIQLLIARHGNKGISRLLKRLKEIYTPSKPEMAYSALEQQYAQPSRFDSAEVMFFKRMLQFVLPGDQRKAILDKMFAEFMDVPEEILAAELYMSPDMLRVMAKNGMHIGSHGADHVWLDKLPQEEQRREINQSLEMLRNIYGADDFCWSICYPFGAYNEDTISLCEAKGCAFGVTTEPRVADLESDSRFKLPRLDTNDLYK